jgi:hypothetical protein
MTEYLTDNYDTQSRMYRVIQDMEAMGADIGEIEDKIGARLKNKKRLNAIMNGEFIAPNISEARVESIIERLYDENPTKAAEVEDQFDDAIDIFEDLRFDLEAIELGEGVGAFQEFINGTVPVSGIAQLPNVELPPPAQIGTGVNVNLFRNNTNAGTQFNLLPNAAKFDKLFPLG